MRRGLLQTHLDAFDTAGAHIADKRREGYDKQYEYADALKGAYGIFFFQHPSMLEYQERLKRKNERSNAQTILRVNKIPSANHITRLWDEITPENFSAVFNAGLQTAQQYGALDRYQVLGAYHLVALDGVWFYQSGTVQCAHCLHQKKADGEPLYYHDMVAAVMVKHGQETVLPLTPECIRNEDGQEKQDCERTAAKRWLESNGERYRWLNPVFLGDDLYADYPTCRAILEKRMHFLFTCKPDSHPWLYDSIDDGCMERKNVKTWTGRQHLEYRYRWYNGVEIRAEQPTLTVNYLSLEIWNKEKGKVTYRNSWVTDLGIDEKNVVEMVHCARARWKIENEHNNVLKHHGYHLEHNVETKFPTGMG
ncbi:MAG: ISNCY family transposase, partial [Treponema sp.]|nr:ISNCY family transposase [Treponema sp.]